MPKTIRVDVTVSLPRAGELVVAVPIDLDELDNSLGGTGPTKKDIDDFVYKLVEGRLRTKIDSIDFRRVRAAMKAYKSDE